MRVFNDYSTQASDILKGVRVLVVDDDDDAQVLLEAVLAYFGAEVRAVASAPETLEALGQWLPDVLVCHIGMPDEHGYSLIRNVRALKPERGGRIPAVALTALTRTEDVERAFTAGFQVHLSKPTDSADLARVVSMLAKHQIRGQTEKTSKAGYKPSHKDRCKP